MSKWTEQLTRLCEELGERLMTRADLDKALKHQILEPGSPLRGLCFEWRYEPYTPITRIGEMLDGDPSDKKTIQLEFPPNKLACTVHVWADENAADVTLPRFSGQFDSW